MRNLTTRSIAAAAVIATLALSACDSGSDSDKKDSRTSSSADKDAGESSGSSDPSESSGSESEAPTSAPATDANGREILPNEQPQGFEADDTSAPFKFGVIVNYVNKYPGWIVLSTEAPQYDAAAGGYRVPVYFSASAGSDIILRDEFTMKVDGQTYTAAALEPTGSGGINDWLPGKTPIGNRPDATDNYAFGDVVFVMPQTQSPLEMHYDNKDGDVHITWTPDGKEY